MADPTLTAEQEAEAQRLAEIIAQKAKEEALRIARLLVSKADHDLLGATEFEVRDRVHAIGAHALETALRERKKGARGADRGPEALNPSSLPIRHVGQRVWAGRKRGRRS